MFRKLSLNALVAALVLSFGTAYADSAPSPVPGAGQANLPKPIATMQQRGVLRVVKRFSAPAGLTGYVLNQGGRYMVVYARGGYVLTGALVDPDGHNLSAQYYAQYVPKPDYLKAIGHLEHDGALITLSKNAAAPVLYAFEDPNCIFCYRFNKEIFPLIDQGKVQLKIALVAFLKADSLARATAILAAKDPRAAMRENEDKYVASGEEGGYPAPAKPEQKFVTAVQANNTTMREAGFSGTPAILYRVKNGQWNGLGGMPDMDGLKKIIDGVAVTAR